MTSIARIKTSDGSGNSSLATVTTTRAALASTILVDTVLNLPTTFFGTMGTPHTFTDPVTSETITVISEATAVDFQGSVDGANIEIDAISPGYTDAGSAVGDIIIIRPTSDWGNEVVDALEVVHNDDGTLKTNSVTALSITDAIITNAKLDTTAGELGGEWQDYTPVMTAVTTDPTLGNGNLSGRYIQIGKIVHYSITFVKGSTGTNGSGAWRLSLPVDVSTNGYWDITSGNLTAVDIGQVSARDVGVNSYFGFATFSSNNGTDKITMNIGNHSTSWNNVSDSAPFTFGSGDSMKIFGTYEAA